MNRKLFLTIFAAIFILPAALSFAGCGSDKQEQPNPLITYTVTFNSKGGTQIYPIPNVKHGSKIVKPTNPSKYGYRFSGWFRSDGTEWNFSTDKVYGDITLIAHWITY